MSKTAITVGSILGIIALVGVWFAGNYNSLVTARNQVDNSWASVETQYQRRLDLIDNLVQSVKGAQKNEQVIFTAIAEARQRVATAGTIDDKVKATNDMETNIALLPRLQEAYPELKSNELMNKLMNELSGTENGIATKRDEFNKTATNYNTNIGRFPKNMFAKTFGFEKVSLFKSEKGAEKGAKVSF